MSYSFKAKQSLSATFEKYRQEIPKIKDQFLRDSKTELKEIIVDDNISKGLSPVQGEGKYEAYSESYKEAIRAGRYKSYSKSTTPVNLELSGKMLNSFKVSKTSDGIKVEFTDPKAKYHNDLGAGQSRTIRPMLPGSGGNFKTSIIKQINDLLSKAIDKVLGKIK